MKKLMLMLILLVVSTSVSFAQDTNAMVDNYNQDYPFDSDYGSQMNSVNHRGGGHRNRGNSYYRNNNGNSRYRNNGHRNYYNY